jgi:serine/threonine protein kinase
MFEVGSQPIPGHRLTKRLGAGAFSEVWEAVEGEGRVVALKFLEVRSLPASMLRDEVRVLQNLAEIRHPGIIDFYGVHANARYIVLSMERADGNLAQLHRTYREEFGTNIPRAHALELLTPAAEALDFLAGASLPGLNVVSRGLQHCDVKPANLLMVGDRLKVGDFGLCVTTNARARRGDGLRGTPPYAAPEMFRGQPSERSDQYSLAVTWCELVAGREAFLEASLTESGWPALPVELMRFPRVEARVVARALHRQPPTRWPSCCHLLRALREAGQGSRQLRRLMRT